jgi:uncharacterized protein with NRDE domain
VCLIALALGQHPRFPLVIAANRDEFTARPAAPLQWWPEADGGRAILAGRDLESGGTWLGLSNAGRLAMLTNVREPQRTDPRATSRGHLVPQWLSTDESFERFWQRTLGSTYNGFNLIAADVQRGEWHWASNRSATSRALPDGVYAVSNALLDTAWPKTAALKHALRKVLDDVQASPGACAADLAERLFSALSDRQGASDSNLPSTGVSLALERVLSSAFICKEDGSYGTRCSTVIVTEHQAQLGRSVTHVIERSFDRNGEPTFDRQELIDSWPDAAPSPMQQVERSG